MKTATLYYMKSILIWGLIALTLSACGKKGNDEQHYAGNVCPAGFNHQANGVCYDGFGNPISQAAQVGMGYISTNFPTSYNPSTMTVGPGYKLFLKEALGVCDRGHTAGGIYNCQTWMSGYAQLVVQSPLDTNTRTSSITFFAYPRTNDNYWYGYQLPSFKNFLKGLVGFPVISNVGAYRNPLNINLTVSNVNQDRGFEGRNYGAYDTTANTGLIQLVVPEGKLSDNTFRYSLYYKRQLVGQGVLNRCINANCQ